MIVTVAAAATSDNVGRWLFVVKRRHESAENGMIQWHQDLHGILRTLLGRLATFDSHNVVTVWPLGRDWAER